MRASLLCPVWSCHSSLTSSSDTLESTMLLTLCNIYIWSSWWLIYPVSSESTDTVCIHRFTACSSSLRDTGSMSTSNERCRIHFYCWIHIFPPILDWQQYKEEHLNRFPLREKDTASKILNTFPYFWIDWGTWAFLVDLLLMYYPFFWRSPLFLPQESPAVLSHENAVIFQEVSTKFYLLSYPEEHLAAVIGCCIPQGTVSPVSQSFTTSCRQQWLLGLVNFMFSQEEIGISCTIPRLQISLCLAPPSMTF